MWNSHERDLTRLTSHPYGRLRRPPHAKDGGDVKHRQGSNPFFGYFGQSQAHDDAKA